MNMLVTPPAFSAEAYDLQRRYAAHMLLLRGFVSGAPIPEPSEDSFDISETCVTAGQTTNVIGEFASPPLLAYVDAAPTRIIPAYNPESHRTAISLVAPQGIRGGPVRLVWPTKILFSRRPLWIAGERLDLRQQDATPGGDLIIGLFLERPLEVHIGMRELPPDAITWENCVLQVRLPADVGPGFVLVVTQNHVYRSPQEFRPAQRKKVAA